MDAKTTEQLKPSTFDLSNESDMETKDFESNTGNVQVSKDSKEIDDVKLSSPSHLPGTRLMKQVDNA